MRVTRSPRRMAATDSTTKAPGCAFNDMQTRSDAATRSTWMTSRTS